MQFSSPLQQLFQVQTAEHIPRLPIKGQSCSFTLGSLHLRIKTLRSSDVTMLK